MGAYNFKKQFESDIMADLKRHTIRAKRKDGRRPKPGELLSLYLGMRTKQCRLMKRRVCVRVQEIMIQASGDGFLGVQIDGVTLSVSEKELLARSDGFQDFAAMFDFWISEHADELGGIYFPGYLIHWESDTQAAARTNSAHRNFRRALDLATGRI